MGAQLRETPRTVTALLYLGVQWEALNWAPIMPKDASLLDSQCEMLQSGRVGFVASEY